MTNDSFEDASHLGVQMRLTIVITFLFVIGCEHSPQTLNDRSIELMSNSGYAFATIERHTDKPARIELAPKDYEVLRLLIRTLAPIGAARPGTMLNSEYTLSYQGGMDPTQIHVRIEDDQLKFQVADHIYVGGDAAEFQSRLPKFEDEDDGKQPPPSKGEVSEIQDNATPHSDEGR